MQLSIIIPSRTASNLIPCVEAVHRLEPLASMTIIDDGLEDSYQLALSMFEENVCFLNGIKPFIYSRAVNQGIQATQGDVVLLNDDAILKTPGGFTAMQRLAEEHQEYGIIGAVTDVTCQPLQRPHGIGLREVPNIAFVCVFIPRRTIEQVGLLDERYCLDYGWEDQDYCESVKRADLKIGVYDGCMVNHSSLRSTYRGDPYATKDYSQNLQLFRNKWGNLT